MDNQLSCFHSFKNFKEKGAGVSTNNCMYKRTSTMLHSMRLKNGDSWQRINDCKLNCSYILPVVYFCDYNAYIGIGCNARKNLFYYFWQRVKIHFSMVQYMVYVKDMSSLIDI